MAPLRTALLQGPAGVPATVADTLRVLDEAAAQAAAQGARLLATSELFLTGYALGDRVAELAEPADGPAAARVDAIAARHGIAIAYGFPERATAEENRTGLGDGDVGSDTVFNAVRLVGPDGTGLAVYRKTHLFGDYERAAFTPGDRPLVQATVDGVRVGLLVCYDVEFPEAVRNHALAGTELLVVPTALMRPYEFVPQVLVPARAYENGMHVAYANRCGREGEFDFAGLSCLAGPDGTVRARAGAGAELLVGSVDPEAVRAARTETPYLADRRPELYRSLT